MQPYQERVVSEKSELEAKITKLREFLAEPQDITNENTVLLEVQLAHMANYATVLARRIELFD